MFSLLGRPYYRRNPARCLLIVAGIALAVALYAGMLLGNASLEAAFQGTLDRVSGRAELQIAAVDGVTEDTLEKAWGIDCVQEAAAVMLRLAPVQISDETALAVLGVDLLEDDRFRHYQLEGEEDFGDSLLLLAQPNSVLITREFAAKHDLSVGATLPVWISGTRQTLAVRGLLGDTDLTRAYDGNLAVMDLYAAQHTFGRRGFFDRVDVQVASTSSVDACRSTISEKLGSHLDVTATPRGGGSAQTFTQMYSAIVDASILLAMLAALLLIHHGAALGVAQREREIAILLGLGANERQIFRFVLSEAAIAGAVAGGLGVAIGILAAMPFAGALQGLLRSALGFVVEVQAVDVDPLWVGATVLGASLASMAGAWSGANYAASVPPIQLAEARRYSSPVAANIWAKLALAAGVGVSAFCLEWLWRVPDALYLGLPLAFVAFWQFGAAADARFFASTKPFLALLWPLEARLAADSLIRAGRRARGALLAVAFSASIVLTVSGVTGAYGDKFLNWATRTLRADFVIHSAPSLSEHGSLLPAGLRDRLLNHEDVDEVARIRRMTGRAAGRRARLFAVDLAIWSRKAEFEKVVSGRGAVVARNFASRAGIVQGDEFEVQTPTGPVLLRAELVVEDYISELGAIYFDWEVYRRHFSGADVEMLGIFLKQGVEPEAFQSISAGLLPEGAPAILVSPRQIGAHISSMVEQWRRTSYLQAATVLPLAILAVGGFLTFSILARRHEFSILEALGATPEQIRRCILLEATTLALAGTLLGLAGGALLQMFVLFSLRQSLLGFDLPFQPNWGLALGLLVAAPVGAMVAAWRPIRAQSREPLARQLSSA